MSRGAFLKHLANRAARSFGRKGIFQSEYDEANSCRRKIRHSKASAIRAAEAMQGKTGAKFTVYECVYCHGWHIGKDKYISASISWGEAGSPVEKIEPL